MAMSTVNASLRGTDGGVLPADMKDLLNDKFAAASSCKAVENQMCVIGGTTYGCASNASTGETLTCSYVHDNHVKKVLGREKKSGEKGKKYYFCRPRGSEVEFVDEAITHDEACGVLTDKDGGCANHDAPGLHCKDDFTCVGYDANVSPGSPVTLGKCVKNKEGGDNAEAEVEEEDAE